MTQRLFVATRKGLFIWSRRTGGWAVDAVHFLGEPVTMLLAHPDDGTLYAALTLGHFGAKLHRLPPGTDEWQGVCGARLSRGRRSERWSSFRRWVAKEEACQPGRNLVARSRSQGQPNVLWAGTIPGGLFRSDDRGQSWQLIESLWNRPERARWFGGGKDDPGIHSIYADPADSRRLRVAVSCGGVWQSTDGGASWDCTGEGLRAEYMPPNLAHDPVAQDPHRVAFCAAAPDTAWMQHHHGSVSVSRRRPRWRELATPRPSPFGFAAVAHPHDPQTAWFAPAADDECRTPVDARLVVSRTRDGGETFEVLGRGLPEKDCYEIVYRHALDVDSAGKIVAMGTTTGGLWISENAGDDWSTLSHTLPPVYCVRFEPPRR